MKKIILCGVLAFGMLACESKNENSLRPEIEKNVFHEQVDMKTLKNFEAQIGINPYAEVFSKKTWQEIDIFYKSLPNKAQGLNMPDVYLSIMQHNLIYALVTWSSFMEHGTPNQFAYYAQEFERLGAPNAEVAAFLYEKVKTKFPAESVKKLYNKSKNANLAEFKNLRKDILKMQ